MGASFEVANNPRYLPPSPSEECEKKNKKEKRGEHLVRRTAVYATTRQPHNPRAEPSPPVLSPFYSRVTRPFHVWNQTRLRKHRTGQTFPGDFICVVPCSSLESVASVACVRLSLSLPQRPPLLLLPSRQGDAVSVRRRATKTGWSAEDFRWGNFQVKSPPIEAYGGI